MDDNYKVVIGLEIHAELLTKTKLFCSCKTSFGCKPSTHVCPICTGLPGALPTLNKRAVELSIMAGIILNCEISPYSRFDRKSYFYHDLPKGYQVTQKDYPICLNGNLEVNGLNVPIKQIHLEEDTGKSTYNKGKVFVDYNRCGVPLIEIVTNPCFSNSKEVKTFIEELGLLLKYADICDMKMEEGSFRIDVNISVNKKDNLNLGTRVEIKNLGSIKSLVKAIEYETLYQKEKLTQGLNIKQETKRYNEKTGTTVSIRAKEDADDYKYINEYNILPLYISQDDIEKIKINIKELPHEKKARFIQCYKLKERDVNTLISKKAATIFFEESVNLFNKPSILCKFILNEILSYTNNNDDTIPINKHDFVYIINLLYNNKISLNSAKAIVKKLFETDLTLETIMTNNNYIMQTDIGKIKETVVYVVNNNKKALAQYISGDKKVYSFFIGECIKELKTSVNINLLKEILTSILQKY